MRRVPALGLGAALAAVLLLVIVYPGGKPDQLIGLSSVTWDMGQAAPDSPTAGVRPKHPGLRGTRKGPAQPSSIPADRPRVAMIVIMKGFDAPWAQGRVDALYQALKPTPDVRDLADFVSPAQVEHWMLGAKTDAPAGEQLWKRMSLDLKLSHLMALTIIKEGDRFGIQSSLIDPASGKTATKDAAGNVSGTELDERLRDLAWKVLLTETAEPGPSS